MSERTNGDRAESYEALRQSEELHRTTLTHISDAVFLTDDNRHFTYICPNVDVIFGYVPDEVRAMPSIDRLLGPNLFDLDDLVRLGEIRNIEREVVSKTGERRIVLVHLKRTAIQGGTVLYTCRDITELRHAEHALRATRLELAHASRLTLIGELMASITHEIRQPLTSIHANAAAGRRIAGGDEERAIFQDILQQAMAACEIIDRLRALVRRQPFSPKLIDVNEVVTDMVRFIEGDARWRGIAIFTDLDATLAPIEADRVSLQQVLLNLLVNALDAQDDLTAPDRHVTVRTQTAGNGAVEVSVSDAGPGIADDLLPRIFDAFVTTKADGLGLGLAISRSIVEAHQGRIWAERKAGGGTTLRFSLPAAVPVH